MGAILWQYNLYISYVKCWYVAHHVESILVLFLVVFSTLAKGIVLIGLIISKFKGLSRLYQKGIDKKSYRFPQAFSSTLSIYGIVSASSSDKRKNCIELNTFLYYHQWMSTGKPDQYPHTLHPCTSAAASNPYFYWDTVEEFLINYSWWIPGWITPSQKYPCQMNLLLVYYDKKPIHSTKHFHLHNIVTNQTQNLIPKFKISKGIFNEEYILRMEEYVEFFSKIWHQKRILLNNW